LIHLRTFKKLNVNSFSSNADFLNYNPLFVSYLLFLFGFTAPTLIYEPLRPGDIIFGTLNPYEIMVAILPP